MFGVALSMENVLLIIHLLLALLLIGAVLIQRSEGGALGMGGGGNVMSGRSAATALQKATWGLCAAFIATSLILTIVAVQGSGDDAVLDRLLQPVELPDSNVVVPPTMDELVPPTPEAPAGEPSIPSLGDGATDAPAAAPAGGQAQ